MLHSYIQRQKRVWKHNFWQFLIAIDQLVNGIVSIIIGIEFYSDETISSRCYRWRKDGKYVLPEKIINLLFFFDKDKNTGKRHCELSYDSERLRLQCPPELRTIENDTKDQNT